MIVHGARTAAFNPAARVARVGYVTSDLHQDLDEAEYVSADVVADGGRLRRLLLVENVLERIALPVAERRLPLIIVLDGMSVAVGCQPAEDIIAQPPLPARRGHHRAAAVGRSAMLTQVTTW